MTEFLGRSAWATEPEMVRGGAELTGEKLVGIAWHWPGTSTDEFGIEDQEKVASRIRGWWDYHVNTRNWSDIGYNFAIDQAGRVWDLRGLGRVGAHCASAANPDANHEWMGVLLILGDEEIPTAAMIQAALEFRVNVFLKRWPGRTQSVGHGEVPGASTECPGDQVRPLTRTTFLESPVQQEELTKLKIALGVSPLPDSIELEGNVLVITYHEDIEEPTPSPTPQPIPDPDPMAVPARPADSMWDAGKSHASFTLMGERFLDWLTASEISHDGNGYQPGPVYSEYDDFNVRKVQYLMGNAPDPAGKAYLGPLQWERLFEEDRPVGVTLPESLSGRVPPQMQTTTSTPSPAPAPSSPSIPPLPSPGMFVPGKSHSSFTAMGKRFLVWLKSDEIHKAGSVYTPGPVYSVYDDRNVRAVQALMGNRVDPAGEEYFGPEQWKRLFTEGRPAGASVPSALKPGGSAGSGSTASTNIPVAGRRITQHFGVPGNYAAKVHTGVDFGSNGDDRIRCVAAGKVVFRGYDKDGWGNYVIVYHSASRRYSWYCHLASVKVNKGDTVTRGTLIGMMGSTGNSRGKHLHYQESTGGYAYRDYKKPVLLGFAGY